MNILIDSPQAQNPPTEVQAWRGIAERRLRFAVRRLRDQVLQAQVRLVDLKGPQGRIVCQPARSLAPQRML